MKGLFIFLIVFVMIVSVTELSLYACRTMRHPDRRRIRKRLRDLPLGGETEGTPDITRKRALSDVPFLNGILVRIPRIDYLNRLLRLASAQHRLGLFLLLAAVLALTGFLGGSIKTNNHLISTIIAGFLGSIPFLYLLLKKRKRMEKFQRQLPEALDLIARSLKAGHSFPSAMKFAADEFDDPLGPEFHETLNEMNFGVSVGDALKNLAKRIDCPDLKYFVISVILQRETGGNLAEIVEGIAYIIRERFKLKGKIRTLSAEGKLSAVILVAIPFLLLVALRFLNPAFVSVLFSDPAGKMMVGTAALMMVTGILVITKMVNIRV
jgi:tight adherence protein B